jgi:ABC-2 type transport system permease protein
MSFVSDTPAHLPNTFANRMMTWWMVMRIALEERLAYRGDFALGTLMRFLPIVTQIFLWGAVFSSLGDKTESGAKLGGYNFPDMVAYFLLTMLARAFSSMPGLASGIATQIRQGEIKRYLIQPVDLIGFLLLSRIAHKLAYYFVATLPFALVFFLCRGFFTDGFPPPHVLVAFIGSLVMGFLAGFLFGSHHRHDRLLVPGSQFAAIHLHAVQFLPVRPHVSVDTAARIGADHC